MPEQPPLDWTFEQIPADPGDAPPPGSPPSPSHFRAPRPLRRPLPRWAWWLGFGLIAGLVLGGYVYTRLGWANLEAQLRAEVLTEDAYSRAGDTALVADLIGDDQTSWGQMRQLEAAYQWGAPQPAPQLLPLDEPPTILSVTPAGGSYFNVTVLRRYTDSAGQVAQFELVQRYHNLGPGLWEHVAPPAPGLAPSATYTLTQLTATYGAADAAVLQPLLARVDAYLQRACQVWDCPPDLRAAFVFNLSARFTLWPPARANTASVDPYPGIFDVAAQPPNYPLTIRLPVLGSVGVPHDAPAADALVHALTVSGLEFLAGSLSGRNRAAQDYYLDALIARTEQRLGLSPALPATLPAEAAWPPGLLWSPGTPSYVFDLPRERPSRVVALQFLNTVLLGQPAALDGQLLATLRQPANAEALGLRPWLEATLGAAVTAHGYAQWARATAPVVQSAQLPPVDGLLLSCQTNAWLIAGGDAVLLPASAFAQVQPSPRGFSADGRYFAYVEYGSRNRLHVVDFSAATNIAIPVDPGMGLVGWSAHNQLLYTVGNQQFLWIYDPPSATSGVLLEQTVGQTAWLHDQQTLLANVSQTLDDQALGQLALIDVTSGAVQPLLTGPVDFALSPSDDQLAYAPITSVGNGSITRPTLELLDLTTGAQQTLVTADQIAAQLGRAEAGPFSIYGVTWSPDGRRLSGTLGNQAMPLSMFMVALDPPGQVQPVGTPDQALAWAFGFSADSRYLAGIRFTLSADQLSAGQVLVVSDLAAGTTLTATVQSPSAAWSPTGHLLAVASDSGVSLFDPATGHSTLVLAQYCPVIQWYAPPSSPATSDS